MKKALAIAVSALAIISFFTGVLPANGAEEEFEEMLATPTPVPRDLAIHEMEQWIRATIPGVDSQLGALFYVFAGTSDARLEHPAQLAKIYHDMEYEPAREWLFDSVINPLLESKRVDLQKGDVFEVEELTRLNIAKLLYYYVRDKVDFMGTDLVEGWMVDRSYYPEIIRNYLYPADYPIPLGGLIPPFCKYPVQTLASRKGFCESQAPALACLLKLMGFEVAMGYIPNIPLPYFYGLPHCYCFLKDEGWGIGDWELEEDMFGDPMPGKWIRLDPIWNPVHSGGVGLEFGQDLPLYEQPEYKSLMTWGLV